jgi:hypothetical protein
LWERGFSAGTSVAKGVGKTSGGLIYKAGTSTSTTREISTAATAQGSNKLSSAQVVVKEGWTWTQSLISFIAFFVLLRFIPTILRLLSDGIQRLANILKWFSGELQGVRETAANKRNNGGGVLISAGAWFVDTFVLFILLFFGFCIACLDVIVQLCMLICKYHYILLGLVICKVICDIVEYKYTAILNLVNAFVLVGEHATNTIFSGLNKLIVARNLATPWWNEAWRSGVDTLAIVNAEFNNHDGIMFGGGISEFMNPGRGRSLEEASSFDDIRLKTLKEFIVTTSEGMLLWHKLENFIMAFQLALIHPIFFLVMDLLNLLLPKASCAFAGGWCFIPEFVNFGIGLFVDFISLFLSFGIFNIHIPHPNPPWSCGADILPKDPWFVQSCGGRMSDIEPPGAFYEAVKGLSSTARYAQRRLEEEKRVLHCDRRPSDGMWIESFNGRVLHESHVNPCPLTKRAFHPDSLLVAQQMNNLGIDTESCYFVCTAGIYQHHCFHGYSNVTRTIIGQCEAKVTIPMKSTDDARRHLANYFPSHYFHWTEANAASAPPTAAAPPAAGRQTSTNTVTQEEAVKALEEELGSKKFVSGGVQCDIHWPPMSTEEIFIQLKCIVSKMFIKFDPKMRQSMRDWVTNPPATARGRNLRGGEGMQHTETTRARLWKTTQDFTGYIGEVQKLMRAYTATSPKLVPRERLYRALMTSKNPPKEPIGLQELFPEKRPSRRLREVTEAPSYGKYTLRDPEQIGDCPFETPVPCPCNGGCVPLNQLDLCPQDTCENNPDVSFIDMAHKAIHDLALTDWNPEQMLTDATSCYDRIRQNGNLDPMEDLNLRSLDGIGDAEYCLGFSVPISYRFPAVEPQGINRFVVNSCMSNFTNTCTCGWYYQSYFKQEAFVFNFISVELEYRIINAFISVQWLAYATFFGIWPIYYWAIIWEAFWLKFGDGIFPPWFIYIWSDLGIRNVSGTQRWICFLLHLGSLFTLYLMVFILLCLFWSTKPMRVYIWNLRTLFYGCCRRNPSSDPSSPSNSSAGEDESWSTGGTGSSSSPSGIRRRRRRAMV